MVSEETRTDLIRLAVLWLVLSVIIEAVALYFVGDYPGTASRQGDVAAEAFLFLLWFTIPVFVLVVLVVAYSLIRFRVGDDDDRPADRQYRSARAFPWAWVAMSTILNILFIIHPGITGLTSIWSHAQAATDPLEVEVTAGQWQWDFDYPGQDLTEQSELVVPVDTPIRFILHSNDVIHSFWVPAWGIKRAVIPGQTQALIITPDEILDTTTNPRARLQCSQICGAGHADMQAAVRVVAKADFDTWVESRREAGHGMEGMEGMKGMEGMDMGGEGEDHGPTEGMDQMNMDHAESPDTPPAPMEGQMPMEMPMQMDGQKPTEPPMQMDGSMPMDHDMPAMDGK